MRFFAAFSGILAGVLVSSADAQPQTREQKVRGGEIRAHAATSPSPSV